MCGIAGRFNLGGAPVELGDIKRMCDAIVHRGPDDEGQFVDGAVGLGMRRLSIIDLSGGHQPMFSDDGGLALVFNGEIYNYRELRRDLETRGHRFRTDSDTESILHAYEAWGPDGLTRLNGMFAIALWDARTQRLLLARDRVGIKPLYIFHSATELRFASEIKALFALPDVPRDLDPEGFAYFLRYGYVAPPRTLLRAVKKLPAATYLLVDRSGVEARKYWSLSGAAVERPEAEQAERLYETFKSAVRRQLVSDVPLGAFLSGGLDSTSIVHLMAEVTGTEVSTYSIGFEGRDEFHSELRDARSTSQHFRTRHHEIVVRPDAAGLIQRLVYFLDEPLADSSFVVTYLVAELAAQTVKVILSGVGGDELFGGYRRYLGAYLAPKYQGLPQVARRGIEAVVNRLPVGRGTTATNYARLAQAFLASQHLGPFEQYDRSVRMMDDDVLAAVTRVELRAHVQSIEAERRDVFDKFGQRDAVSGMLALDFETSLVESLLLLTDKMTMATSLEARVPLLDHEVVEEAFRIPAGLKVKGTQLRHIQRESMKGHLPASVFRKRKRGFGFPIGAWFKTELRELTEDMLSPERLARHGLFERAAVRRLIDEHVAGRKDYSDVLLALLTFELWYDRTFVAPQSDHLALAGG